MTDHQSIQELLPAVAMDVALPDEVSLVHQHLSECGDCRRTYAQMQQTADALATAVPLMDAPPALRSRVLAIASDEYVDEQSAEAQLSSAGVAPTPPNVVPLKKSSRPGRFGQNLRSWIIPSVAVAASLVLAMVAVDLSSEKSSLSKDLAKSRAQLQAAQDAAANAQNTSVSLPTMAADRTIEVPGQGPLQGVQAFVAIQEGSDTGMLVLKDLPQPPHKHSWQTWVQHTDGTQSSVDVRKAGDKVVLIPIKLHEGKLDVEALMITTEPEGGSKLPTTDAIASARIV
jgi:hypothetical protein